MQMVKVKGGLQDEGWIVEVREDKGIGDGSEGEENGWKGNTG